MNTGAWALAIIESIMSMWLEPPSRDDVTKAWCP